MRRYRALLRFHKVHPEPTTLDARLSVYVPQVTRIFEQEIQAKAALPGPGEYKNLNDASVSKDAKRASSVFKSSITRDKAALENSKHSVPGPGTYDGGTRSFASEPKPEHLQFFGSTVSRFDDDQRCVCD